MTTTLITHIPCPAWLGFGDIIVQTEIPDGSDYITRENLSQQHINTAFSAGMAVSAETRNHERTIEAIRSPAEEGSSV